MDLDSAPSAVAVPHTFTLRNRSTVAAQTSVRHDSRIALRQLLCRTLCAQEQIASSLPPLPPPSSFYQPNPLLQTMRAVNSMALGFRPLPPPSSLLPSTPKTNPLCAALCAPPMRGTRLSIDLDRAPCLETSPPTRKLCASPYARDTIFNGFRSCTLLRNHYKKRDPMRKPLCAGHDFQWI